MIKKYISKFHTWIFNDLLRRLSLHLSGNIVYIVTTVFLISFNKLVKISFIPVCKTL